MDITNNFTIYHSVKNCLKPLWHKTTNIYYLTVPLDLLSELNLVGCLYLKFSPGVSVKLSFVVSSEGSSGQRLLLFFFFWNSVVWLLIGSSSPQNSIVCWLVSRRLLSFQVAEFSSLTSASQRASLFPCLTVLAIV